MVTTPRPSSRFRRTSTAWQFDIPTRKTFLDIKNTVDLIAQGMARTTLNNQLPGNDNTAWPDAFEYIYQGTGIGDVINPYTTKIFGLGRIYSAILHFGLSVHRPRTPDVYP